MKKLILLLILLIILESAGIGYLGVWREGFWQAVENRNLNVFIVKITQFTLIALTLCFISGYVQFLINKVSLLFRTILTKKYYQYNFKEIEGGAQRIQEDCFNYPLYGITLLTGVLRSSLTLIVFIVIIVMQLGAIYLLIPIVYTLISTLCAHKLAKPLIKLNYIHQCVEAKFRQLLQNISTVSPKLEKSREDCYTNFMNLSIATKKLQYFQSFYNQITVIVPYLILMPLYFSSKILFGVFMQMASAVSHVIESMSYLINSYDIFNNFLSCKKRLNELEKL